MSGSKIIRGINEREIADFQREWNNEQKHRFQMRRMQEQIKQQEALLYKFKDLKDYDDTKEYFPARIND